MKLLIFVLSTLFVSYKLAGIGGLILSLIPLALILSFIGISGPTFQSFSPALGTILTHEPT